MLNCLMPWNATSGQGNPTRSIEVNTLIKKVKKKEVRKQGVASKAQRAVTHVEFRRIHSILRENNDVLCRYSIPSLLTFQFNMIGRIDDCTQFQMENLTSNEDFDFTLRSKLNWSKNIHEERNAPNQI